MLSISKYPYLVKALSSICAVLMSFYGQYRRVVHTLGRESILEKGVVSVHTTRQYTCQQYSILRHKANPTDFSIRPSVDNSLLATRILILGAGWQTLRMTFLKFNYAKY